MVGSDVRASLVAAQSPVAIILSCSDSRAPSEILFDQRLGDLFVVRVAGNVVAPSLVGSVEFAAATFGTQLVVVMGHSHCDAIEATVRTIGAGKVVSDNIRDIVDRIRPAIEEIVWPSFVRPGLDHAAVLAAATRANVRASANQLRHGSRLLEHLISRRQLVVVGAEYSLETGEVDFFDAVPA